MEAIDIIFRSIFLGFVIWTFIWALSRNKHFSQYNADKIDLLATRIVIALGVFHLLILVFNFIEYTSEEGIKLNQALVDRAFGPYWFGLWMYPITYFGLTQLLWIHRIRTSKLLRIIIAVWIFGVMYFEQIVILITTLHRDYRPG